MNYRIEAGREPEKLIPLLEEKIYSHNARQVKKDDGVLFSIITRDETGEIVAGVAGWTWAGACEITQLWVDEKTRGHGIGELLLKAAEDEAKHKGCRRIMIKTYSFQAPDFYQKFGYKVEYVLQGFPDGFDYYTLTKKIG